MRCNLHLVKWKTCKKAHARRTWLGKEQKNPNSRDTFLVGQDWREQMINSSSSTVYSYVVYRLVWSFGTGWISKEVRRRRERNVNWWIRTVTSAEANTTAYHRSYRKLFGRDWWCELVAVDRIWKKQKDGPTTQEKEEELSIHTSLSRLVF